MAALVLHAFREGGFIGAIDRFLDHHHHRQRHGCNQLRLLPMASSIAFPRHDPRHQPGALCFCRIHHAARQAHVHCLGFGYRTRQTLRAASAGYSAELDFRLPAPRAAGRDTLYARMQQFATRMYGPLFTAGLRYWQLGESHYWGHNAIIRVAPFIRHCALERLPGTGALWARSCRTTSSRPR